MWRAFLEGSFCSPLHFLDKQNAASEDISFLPVGQPQIGSDVSRGFNAVIGACKEDGRWAEAVSLLFLMEEGSYPPDVVSDSSGSHANEIRFPMTHRFGAFVPWGFGSAISACDVAGHWEAALGLLICMQEKKAGICDDGFCCVVRLSSNDTKNHRLAQVLPNILCFSGALLSLRGMQAAPLGVWCMAMGLLKQVYMARVAMDVSWMQLWRSQIAILNHYHY